MTNRQPLSLTGLTGERGLLAAVIARAVKDVSARNDEVRATARLYFLGYGGVYRHHLELLELPPETLPVALQGE